MDEDIRATVVGDKKAIALAAAKLLYSAQVLKQGSLAERVSGLSQVESARGQ